MKQVATKVWLGIQRLVRGRPFTVKHSDKNAILKQCIYIKIDQTKKGQSLKQWIGKSKVNFTINTNLRIPEKMKSMKIIQKVWWIENDCLMTKDDQGCRTRM